MFARLSNFETFERIAIKRNVRVSQISQNNPNEDTQGWNCSFKVRGRQRDVEIRLIEFDEPNSMKFHAVNPALHARLDSNSFHCLGCKHAYKLSPCSSGRCFNGTKAINSVLAVAVAAQWHSRGGIEAVTIAMHHTFRVPIQL